MAQRMNVFHYEDVIKELETQIQNLKPIKKIEFCKKHLVDVRLLKTLESLKIIEPLQSSLRVGTVYDWINKDKTKHQIAEDVINQIYKENHEAHLNYSSEKAKLKRFKKEHKAKSNPPKQSIQESTPELIQIPQSIETPAAPQPTTLLHKEVKLSLSGALTKSELILKITSLIEDLPISNFSFEVAY